MIHLSSDISFSSRRRHHLPRVAFENICHEPKHRSRGNFITNVTTGNAKWHIRLPEYYVFCHPFSTFCLACEYHAGTASTNLVPVVNSRQIG